MTARDPLAGTWHLRECRGNSSDGREDLPYGEHPAGMLVYDGDGNMCVTLMRAFRRSFASDDALQAEDGELAAAWREFDAYSGGYTLDIKNGTVTHHVRQAKFPNWIGTDQLRHFTRQGNRLILRSEPIRRAGSEWIFTLVWSRQEDDSEV